MPSRTLRLLLFPAVVLAASSLAASPLIVAAPPVEAQRAGRIVVSNEGAGTVTVVDIASLRVEATIRVGPQPHNLAALPGGLVLVATQGAREISMVAPAPPGKTRRMRIPAVPHDVAAGIRGRGYVLSAGGLLLTVDVQTARVIARTDLGGRPHDMAVVGDEIWVTDISRRDLTVVDGGKLTPIARMRLPSPGHDLAARPGADEVWITPWTGNEIAIVHRPSRQIRRWVKVGRSPQHLAFTADGREVWITETESERVYVVEASTGRVVGRIDLRGPPHHVAVAGRRAYVAIGPSSLVVIDIQQRQIIRRLRVGLHPHHVVVF